MTTPYLDTHTMQEGPALHPWLLPVQPFLGIWRGRGKGGYPTLTEDFAYEQEISLSHDGRPFLRYEARAWLIDENGTPIRPSGRESGWFRVAPDGYLEALVNHPTGISEIYVGQVSGPTIDLATHEVTRTPLAKEVVSGRRRYTLGDGGLSYEHDLEAVGRPTSPHLSAHLRRVAEVGESD
ncbi:FABP family protein [Streptomyces sp. NPDC004647]|uniref:FABP family protein n=1 Tax=Streptomyces sp. NPDC004647 TaxID=3154671 RepID=UPI0033A0D780